MADSEPNETAQPRKGLWALMGQKRDESDPAETVPETLEGAPPEIAEPSTVQLPPKPVDRPRGLWSLMQSSDRTAADGTGSSATSQQSELVEPEMQSAFVAPIKGADKRLRQMQATESSALVNQPDIEPILESAIEPAEATARDTQELPSAPSQKPVSRRTSAVPEWDIPQPASAVEISGTARQAWSSMILGAISVPISLIAIFPATWTRIPPSLCGFTALMLGFLALSEIKGSRGRLRGQSLAYSGILLGLLGMFAGPLIFSPLDLYGRGCDWHTGGHLQQLGIATDNYYVEHHEFPSGGLFRQVKQGQTEAFHGWMTLLLPYLPDGAALASQIDFDQPYHATVNLPVMEQRVPSFLAAGGSPALVDEKFGPTHFAGLGGSLTLPDGATGHLGIFDINSSTTREDVVDGLSNTMIAGEIGAEFPAWGEPKNWRLIGKGLNRTPQGFGNARHSGALFLMADGSVRFFPNQTDAKVLQALSTRDGGEGF